MECNIHSLKTDDSEDLCTEALFIRISKKDKARAQMLQNLILNGLKRTDLALFLAYILAKSHP